MGRWRRQHFRCWRGGLRGDLICFWNSGIHALTIVSICGFSRHCGPKRKAARETHGSVHIFHATMAWFGCTAAGRKLYTQYPPGALSLLHASPSFWAAVPWHWLAACVGMYPKPQANERIIVWWLSRGPFCLLSVEERKQLLHMQQAQRPCVAQLCRDTHWTLATARTRATDLCAARSRPPPATRAWPADGARLRTRAAVPQIPPRHCDWLPDKCCCPPRFTSPCRPCMALPCRACRAVSRARRVAGLYWPRRPHVQYRRHRIQACACTLAWMMRRRGRQSFH